MKIIHIPELDDAMQQQPCPWSEMGGADAVRYHARVSELREQLVAMLRRIDEAEMDATYYGSESTHRQNFSDDVADLEGIMDVLMKESAAVDKLMRTGGA